MAAEEQGVVSEAAILSFANTVLFETPGGIRYTQDSPILPNVWLAFAVSPRSQQELILTAANDSGTGRAARELRRLPGTEDEMAPGTLLLQPRPFALVTGALLSIGLFVATNWLWFTTGEWSPNLFLLHNYMPGYEPTFTGSLIGGAWTFLYGAIAAGSLAWIYDSVVKLRYGKSAS